jgi:hypothetical protein
VSPKSTTICPVPPGLDVPNVVSVIEVICTDKGRDTDVTSPPFGGPVLVPPLSMIGGEP